MGENKVFNEKIVIMTGYYDLKGTYKDLIGYLEDTLFYDVSVKDYDEKNDRGARGVNSIVEAERHRDDGLKFVLKFKCEFKGKDVNDASLQKGTAKLMLNAYFDTSDKKDPSKFEQFLDFIFGKFVGHRDADDIADLVGKEAASFVARFKGHFRDKP